MFSWHISPSSMGGRDHKVNRCWAWGNPQLCWLRTSIERAIRNNRIRDIYFTESRIMTAYGWKDALNNESGGILREKTETSHPRGQRCWNWKSSDEVACMSERTAQISQGSIMRPGPGNADPFRKVYEWWNVTKHLSMYTMSKQRSLKLSVKEWWPKGTWRTKRLAWNAQKCHCIYLLARVGQIVEVLTRRRRPNLHGGPTEDLERLLPHQSKTWKVNEQGKTGTTLDLKLNSPAPWGNFPETS